MLHVSIRTAAPEDAQALLAIYAPYVRETAITFEVEVPTPEEFRRRMMHTLARYPYLVAEGEDGILGYAYAGPFKERAAYDMCVETSVYVRQGLGRCGVGGKLMARLEQELKRMGIRNLYACIAVPEKEADETLDWNSQQFHTHLGFRLVGEFRRCGYKFGRFYDMVWMEKLIGQGEASTVSPIVPFGCLPSDT